MKGDDTPSVPQGMLGAGAEPQRPKGYIEGELIAFTPFIPFIPVVAFFPPQQRRTQSKRDPRRPGDRLVISMHR